MAPLSDYEKAKSALEKLNSYFDGHLSFYKEAYGAIQAALTKGQAAEVALEKAIEKLAGTDHCFHPQWGAEHCENQVDCQACWRSFLTKEAK